MRISTQSFFQRTQSGMSSLQQQLFRVQQQLGSGTKFLAPSDDPVAAARALGVSQSMAETGQYAATRGRATQTLSMEENALQSAAGILQDVKQLVVQAGDGTLSDADRSSIATTLEADFSQLLGVANSDDGNGQYLFAGFRSDAAPFAESGGAVSYRGNQGQRLMQVDVARQMAASDDGATVFQSVQGSAKPVTTAAAGNSGTGVFSQATLADANSYTVSFDGAGGYTVSVNGTPQPPASFVAGQTIATGGLSIRIDGTPAAGDSFTVAPAPQSGTDVFATLRGLIGALRTPVTDPASSARLANALSTANVKVTNAHDNILTVRSSVGSRLAELDALDASGNSRHTVDQKAMSQLQDLDYASAISEFSQRQVNLQATEQTFARLAGISLFNYL
jgi:flagellar hook-associated protein 3 FlgL